jgi:NAD(P)-dependent dehydrogenase (short-subunit alcohol dehydrogenase family)
MKRKYLITGSASGIGLATRKKIVSLGQIAIGVDVKGAEVIADLSTNQGREEAAKKALELSGGVIDAVIANAGSGKSEAKTVSINFFGATQLIELLHPALVKSAAPRVVATSSMGKGGHTNECRWPWNCKNSYGCRDDCNAGRSCRPRKSSSDATSRIP